MRRLVQALMAVGSVAGVACEAEEMNRAQNPCPRGELYVVTKIEPYSWRTDLGSDVSLSIRREGEKAKAVCLKGNQSLRNFSVGERVCVELSKENECLEPKSYTITRVPIQPVTEVLTCTVKGSVHFLEWLELTSWMPIDGISAIAVHHDEQGSPLFEWWEKEMPNEAFQNPIIIGKEIMEGTEVNVYRYSFEFPASLHAFLFCGDSFCMNQLLELDFWRGDAAWFFGLKDCQR